MPTLQEIVEKYKIDEADSQALSGFIETEKQKGMSEVKKKVGEFKELLTKHNALRDKVKVVGIDPDDNLEEQVTAIKAKIDKADKPPEGGTLQEIEARLSSNFKKVEKELNEKWQKKLAEEAAAKLEVETKFKNSRITEFLSSMPESENITGKDYVIKDFISSGIVKVNDAGKVVFIRDGEEVDAKEGIETFKKSRPDLVRTNQATGSGGSGSPRNSKNNSGGQTMKYTDWMSLPPKERATFQINEKNIVLPRED